jgi:hypothetical protein
LLLELKSSLRFIVSAVVEKAYLSVAAAQHTLAETSTLALEMLARSVGSFSLSRLAHSLIYYWRSLIATAIFLRQGARTE